MGCRGFGWDVLGEHLAVIYRVGEVQAVVHTLRDVVDRQSPSLKLRILGSQIEVLNLFHGMVVILDLSLLYLDSDSEMVTTRVLFMLSTDKVPLVFLELNPVRYGVTSSTQMFSESLPSGTSNYAFGFQWFGRIVTKLKLTIIVTNNMEAVLCRCRSNEPSLHIIDIVLSVVVRCFEICVKEFRKWLFGAIDVT